MSLRINPEHDNTIQSYTNEWLTEGGNYNTLKMGACLFWTIWKTRNNITFDKENTIKVNFDGAAGDRGHGCGVIARDYKATIQGCQIKELNYMTAVEAKAQGTLLAVELAVNRGFKDVIIEGDSLIIIDCLRFKHYQQPWRVKNIIGRIKDPKS
ncbi:uncharacterized protein LOC113317422 [Papaver somniferum]|uniref:uncharacterized protein LOC113317422 n=1 Tax=Papaver somniferum TaxID=3469 RepID=UPI000E702B3C|nr:uncharacterized protein LOC113317422 [Papaver somniferum]